jgi:Mg-chelatase subunit ChlD
MGARLRCLLALALSAAMSGAASAAPATVELVFVVDTTGSMGGLLEGAKSTIWGIVNTVLQQRGKHDSQVKVGLVAYRDRGDVYLTKVTPLSANLDAVYADLMALRAQGGGDQPEDVRSALRDGVKAAGWSAAGPAVSQILFLVGDAPPHDDYQEVPSATLSASQAKAAGIVVNTIQCGSIGATTAPWRAIAQFGGGEYFAIAQDGGVKAIATPYDAELAQLGSAIGATYLAQGRHEERVAHEARQAAAEQHVKAAAPAPALAERALNKALNRSAYDSADLLQALDSGRLTLAGVPEAELPDSLRQLPAAQRPAKLAQLLAERQQLRERILALSRQRDAYLAAHAVKGGFDSAVTAALLRQLK